MTFHARIDLNGKTATGIRVPDHVVAGLGGGKRPKVRVTLGGVTYPSSVARMGDAYVIPVSADIRERANVRAGDEVDVIVELDDQPREVTVPTGLRAALDAHPEANAAFAALSYSGQRRLVDPIPQAKTEATRQRRVAKVIRTLLGEDG